MSAILASLIQKTVYNKRIGNKFRKEIEAVNHERKLIISVKLHVYKKHGSCKSYQYMTCKLCQGYLSYS